MNNIDKFIWEPKIYDGFKEHVYNEIFNNNIYEKFFEVEENDVVFDIGASLGPFTYSILNKKPKHVFCFEPVFEEFLTLVKNTKHGPVTQINKSITNNDGFFKMDWIINDFDYTDICGISFMEAINLYNINKIDFLKCDCENCEYDIFTLENLDWIKNNVKKISGEWHLSYKENKDKFKYFRDNILIKFNPEKYNIFSVDGVDIKWDLWSDHFIEYYNEVIIYIDNR
jgi:FkbM family methyltransferase